jgi:hypothetical protein
MFNNIYGKPHAGATKVGPCPTDAAPEDRSQRTARVLNRYGAARTDAASVIAALLARWKHTHLLDREATN